MAWSRVEVAAALFLAAGLFHLTIGVLTPVGIRLGWAPGVFVYNDAADRAIFGKSHVELRADADVMKLREILLGMISGLLVGLGLLEMALARWGVRQGQAWAVAAIGIVAVSMAIFWTLGHVLWFRAGLPGGLAALPPFQWVPLVLVAAGSAAFWSQ